MRSKVIFMGAIKQAGTMCLYIKFINPGSVPSEPVKKSIVSGKSTSLIPVYEL